jgi:5-methylcytosine-specific restriction endonuclease McrA
MRDYTLSHLSDAVLLRDLADLIVQERETVASVLAHIAEIDARRLYVPLGYSSMHAYCMEELRLSEDAAYKRIQAARTARRFPVLFTELAEGRLHLTAVCMLAPHLTEENVGELVRAATHRRKSEIDELLACLLQPHVAAGGASQTQLAPEQVGAEQRAGDEIPLAPEQVEDSSMSPALAPGQAGRDQRQLAPEQVAASAEGLVPLMVRPSTRDRLRYVQALLSHAVGADASQVLDRALDLLIEQVEKRKFGTGVRNTVRRRTGIRNRYIPASVRRSVWERDQGQCTFTATSGHRCNATTYLEFDHIRPFALGGEPTVEGLRLRCRAHNQYEAERAFGTEFMERKRDETRKKAEGARSLSDHAGVEEARVHAAEAAELKEQIQDVLAALRGLGVKGEQARRAAAHAETLKGATLVERIRAALQFHGEWVSRSPKAARALFASG